MERTLVRPANALFPAVCLLATLYGKTEETFFLLIFYFALQLLTLCAPDAFRNAAARETGVRRVDQRFGGALTQILIGGGLLAAGFYFMPKPAETDSFRMSAIYVPAAAALCIIIEQTFEERLYALGRAIDGRMLALIANLLLAAGFLLTDGDMLILLCAAGAGVIVSVAAIAAVPFKSFSLIPRNYGYAPKAAVQALLYPLAAAALMRLTGMEMAAALTGWILWRLARTTCRRSESESRPMNLFLTSVCAAAYIAAILLRTGVVTLTEGWITATAQSSEACLLALMCAAAVFLAPSWRLYAGIGLLLLTEAEMRFGILPENLRLTALALPVIAVLLNVKKAFLRQGRA